MVISPRLTTRAPGRSPPPMDSAPVRWKRSASTPWLVATSPPTSMRAPREKITPAPFWITTVPGARIAPSITLGAAASTRLSVADRLSGLREANFLAPADIEALPVDHRALRALADDGAAALLADAGLALGHDAALRAFGAAGVRRCERKRGGAEQRQGAHGNAGAGRPAGGVSSGHGRLDPGQINFDASYCRMLLKSMDIIGAPQSRAECCSGARDRRFFHECHRSLPPDVSAPVTEPPLGSGSAPSVGDRRRGGGNRYERPTGGRWRRRVRQPTGRACAPGNLGPFDGDRRRVGARPGPTASRPSRRWPITQRC